MISCLECNLQFHRLGAHLRKHKITSEEYLKKYPDALLTSEEDRQKCIDYFKLHSHPMSGRHHSEESKKKSSEKHKTYFKEHPEARELISIKTKEAMSRPDIRKKFEEGIKNREPTTENLGKFAEKGRILTEDEYDKSYSEDRNEKISQKRIEWWSDKIGKTVEELYGEEKGKKIREIKSQQTSGENNPAFGKVYENIGRKTGKYKNHKFNGLWELSYWKFLEQSGYNIDDTEIVLYQPNKIPYNLNNIKRNYFPDFLLKKDKKLIEIKSKFQFEIMDDMLKAKKSAAEDWCKQEGYTFHILTEQDFAIMSYSKAYSDPDIVWRKR